MINVLNLIIPLLQHFTIFRQENAQTEYEPGMHCCISVLQVCNRANINGTEQSSKTAELNEPHIDLSSSLRLAFDSQLGPDFMMRNGVKNSASEKSRVASLRSLNFSLTTRKRWPFFCPISMFSFVLFSSLRAHSIYNILRRCLHSSWVVIWIDSTGKF